MESQQFDVDAEVRSALPAVMAKVRENLIDRMTATAEQTAMHEIQKAVQAWAVEQLVPEVKAQLDSGKAGMVAKASEIARALADQLGEAISANAAKTLTNSHCVREICEKLFRGY